MNKYLAGSFVVFLSVVGLVAGARAYYPPIITHMEPQDQTVKSGEKAAWYATIDTKAPVQFQWKLNGRPIPGATSAVLIRHNIQKRDEGTYTLEVKNRFGKTVSDSCYLTVQQIKGSVAIGSSR